jgi:hypothetical protein
MPILNMLSAGYPPNQRYPPDHQESPEQLGRLEKML